MSLYWWYSKLVNTYGLVLRCIPPLVFLTVNRLFVTAWHDYATSVWEAFSTWRRFGGGGRLVSLWVGNLRRTEDVLWNNLLKRLEILLNVPCLLYICKKTKLFTRTCQKWLKTETTPPTSSSLETVAISRVNQGAARRKGSASSGYGVTAGECACWLTTLLVLVYYTPDFCNVNVPLFLTRYPLVG